MTFLVILCKSIRAGKPYLKNLRNPFCNFTNRDKITFIKVNIRQSFFKGKSKMKNLYRPIVALFVFSALLWFASANNTTQTFAQQPAPQPTPVEIKIEPTVFDAYVGQYEDAENLGGTIFSFFREGENFFLQVTNQDKIEIFPSADNKFFLKVFPSAAEFLRDANGRVTGMVWRQGGSEYKTKKIADQPAKDLRVSFKRTEAMIPMRDGVKLFTVIFTPEDQTENLPILMSRTPYGVKGWTSAGVNGTARAELVKDGYVFVFQDIRGRNESEGEFVMLRPPRDKRDTKAIDESTDTFDTIDYLIKNVPKNNGRVGIFGVSYDGWLSSVALLDPHPALKASSPQAPVADFWMGDDFFHHGAFRQCLCLRMGSSARNRQIRRTGDARQTRCFRFLFRSENAFDTCKKTRREIGFVE